MNHERIETDLPINCRRHRAMSDAWEVAVESTPLASRHARECEPCRAHDDGFVRMRRELRALAAEPTADLWPAIHARIDTPRRLVRWPVGLMRAAGILLGFGAALGALCALESWNRASAATEARHDDPFAVLRDPEADRTRVEGAPELQLLALLAKATEERR